MAQYFFDTSGVVKYYHAEQGTLKVAAIFAEPDREIRISSLGFVEVQSAFAMKVRSGALSQEAAGVQQRRFMFDIATGEIEVYSLTQDHFTSAAHLIERYGFQRRLRTLDALQLAVALDLAEQGLLDQFVTADHLLAEIAELERLAVIDPEAL